MKELKNCEFDKVIKLLDLEKVHCTFAYAVIEGKQYGKVYVDNCIEPKSCFIVCKSGKYLVSGDTNNAVFNEFLEGYLKNKENHVRYFDLYSSSQEWISKIDDMLGDNAAKLRRQLFKWDKLNSEVILKDDIRIPDGFELRKMDETLFEKYTKEMDSSYKDLWKTSNNFILNGFGFCILKDNEFVSACNTYYVRDGVVEIDIVTKDQYRKQGFAVITCSEFIKHCLLNNIEPVWDCDDGNEESKKLAVKLGFNSAENYEMHWWHENKSFVDGYLKKFNYNL